MTMWIYFADGAVTKRRKMLASAPNAAARSEGVLVGRRRRIGRCGGRITAALLCNGPLGLLAIRQPHVEYGMLDGV
jgi:hypothetical protein